MCVFVRRDFIRIGFFRLTDRLHGIHDRDLIGGLGYLTSCNMRANSSGGFSAEGEPVIP